MLNKKTIFFDLGNTLIFRKKRHQEYDQNLLKKIYPQINISHIQTCLEKVKAIYPGLYSTNTDNQKIKNINEEKKYVYSAITYLHELLNIDASKINSLIQSREKEKRYFLFHGIPNLLKSLNNSNFQLGIITNGRPSRRLVLQQLNIYKYFKEELIIISDEIQVAKPSPEIFTLAAKLAKTPIEKILVIDDEERNIQQAKISGFDTFKASKHQNTTEIKNYCLKK